MDKTVKGVPCLIDKDVVRESIIEIKNGKSSGLVLEMVKAAGEAVNDMITYLVDQIILKGFIPTEWELSTIANSYKGKYVIL